MAESPATPLPIPPARTENNSSISSSLPPTKSEPTEVTLYIGNIPWSYDNEMIKELVPKASLARVVLGRNGRSRGYALATFSSRDLAQTTKDALEGSEIDGRELRVKFDEGIPKKKGRTNNAKANANANANPDSYSFTGTSLHVTNLDFGTTNETLVDFFADSIGAEIRMNSKGMSRGWGLVTFASAEQCNTGLEFVNGGVELDGRLLGAKLDVRN